MKNLFIVIVDFYAEKDLLKLVKSLKREKVSGWKVNFKIINNNKKNLGFAKSANIGIRYALEKGADRVLLLNPDTIIERGFLEELLDNQNDIVAPVIKFKRNNKWVYDFGGKVNWWIGRTWHKELEETRSLAAFGMTNVDYLSGCCMLVKRQVFEKIGLFDERFFLYFEDADFCIRAKRAGFQIAAEPKSEIVHQLIEGKKRSFSKKYHLWRSNFIFINKYLGIKIFLGYLYLAALAIKMLLNRFVIASEAISIIIKDCFVAHYYALLAMTSEI